MPRRIDKAQRRVSRTDRVSFSAVDLPARRPAPGGAWDCAGVFARDGVQLYEDEQGQPVREARPRSEVMRSAAAMVGLTVTLQHPGDGQDPDGGAGEVTADNAKDLWHGTVLSASANWPSDGLLGGWVRASTAELQAALTSGTIECSVGYVATLRDPHDPDMAELVAELGPEPGVLHDGQRYDLIQTQIEPNHHAIVDQARAGSVARLRLDGQQANMKRTIKIDGKSYQVVAFLADAAKTQALDADAQAKAKTDALEVGPVSIDGTDLVLPRSMIDEMLAMLGGSAGPSAPEPSPTDAMPGDPADELVADELVVDADEEEAAPKADASPTQANIDAMVLRSLARHQPAAAKKIADAVLTTNRERSGLERDASLILGQRHDFKGQDDHAIACAVLKADGSTRLPRAEQLAAKARKGDEMSAGRLREMMDSALDARRDAMDSTGDLALTVFNASDTAAHSDRADGLANEEPEHKRISRERRDKRLNPAAA